MKPMGKDEVCNLCFDCLKQDVNTVFYVWGNSVHFLYSECYTMVISRSVQTALGCLTALTITDFIG